MFFGPTRVWSYGDFLQRAPIEGNEMLRATLQMRGGWQAGTQLRRSFVRFERADYRSYTILGESGVPVPFDPPVDLSGSFGTLLSVTTPIFRTMNAKIDPAIMPGEIMGSVIARNARTGPAPRLRAASSSDTSKL